MRIRRAAVAALGALLLVAAACSNNGNGNEGGGGNGGSTEPITIGISLPLTGDFSQPGGEAKRGYEVWAELTNEAGGLLGRDVELNILDDASDQNTIVSDYNRLISQDKVDLLLGTFSSLLNLPASAVAERNKMVYVEPAGGAPEMFSRGFQYLFFAQQATAPHQADLFARWVLGLPDDQRPKTAAYPTQDDPFTQPVIDGIRSQLEAGGIETVYKTVYPPDQSNFDTIASDIKASGAELVAEGAVFEDGVGIIRSFQKVGYSPKILFETSAPSNSDQFANGIGTENTEGIFYAVSWSAEADTPMNAEFVDRYQQKYGQLPAEDAADAFAAAQVLQAAVEAVGGIDQEKIKDWLHSNEVETILGTLSWDETGAPQQAFLLAQWQNASSEIVLPEDLATSDTIVNPKPDWSS
ncbi:MAG: amino acid ABC transporter substrate-binding protein [Candidatus Velamenicoccus archaeovorus]